MDIRLPGRLEASSRPGCVVHIVVVAFIVGTQHEGVLHRTEEEVVDYHRRAELNGAPQLPCLWHASGTLLCSLLEAHSLDGDDKWRALLIL